MNKIIIPIVLIAIIAIGVGFAFAPVEQAVTVHNDIIQDVSDVACNAFFKVGFTWDGEGCIFIGEA